MLAWFVVLVASGAAEATTIVEWVLLGAPGSNFVDSVVDLSALRELAGEVEFRLLQVGTVAANGGSTARAGTFRVTSYFAAGSFDRNMQFTGTVSAISEPGTYSMAFAGLAPIGFMAALRGP